MKYIGNYKDWIKPEWVEFMENNLGEKHPRLDQEEYGEGNSLEKLKQSGFDLDTAYWYSFEQRTLPFTVTPPFDLGGKSDWWFVKMKPSNFIPFHRDHAPKNDCGEMTARRFWMPLQDYVEGHIFIMGNDYMTGYKAGDVFEYDDETERHAACNISMGVSRYTYNFQFYS